MPAKSTFDDKPVRLKRKQTKEKRGKKKKRAIEVKSTESAGDPRCFRRSERTIRKPRASVGMQTPPLALPRKALGAPRLIRKARGDSAPNKLSPSWPIVWGSRENGMIWRGPLTTARRSEQPRDAVISACHCPSSDKPPRAEVALRPLRQSPTTRNREGRRRGRARQGVGVMQDKDRCHPSPRPHMTSTQTGGCSRVPRCPPKGGVCGGPGYRPNMGVTSSMLLGLEYAAGLREGNGRSELVP